MRRSRWSARRSRRTSPSRAREAQQRFSVRRRRGLVHEVRIDLAPACRHEPLGPALADRRRRTPRGAGGCSRTARSRRAAAARCPRAPRGTATRWRFSARHRRHRRTSFRCGTRTRRMCPSGSSARNPSSRGRSFLRNGGSWNSTGPRFGAERGEIPVEILDRARRVLGLQPRIVRDAPRRLDREAEMLRRRAGPRLEHGAASASGRTYC